MLLFLKKYWLFSSLAFLAVLLFFIKLILAPGQSVTVLTPAPSWMGIVPGKTTAQELERSLGQADSVTQEDGLKVFGYNPKGGGPAHRVVTEREIVVLIKEQYYGESKLSNFKSMYGEPDGQFYGPYQSVGAKVFVFAQNGIATVSGVVDGTTLEIWYFRPTSLDVFLAKWGTGLTTEPKESKF